MKHEKIEHYIKSAGAMSALLNIGDCSPKDFQLFIETSRKAMPRHDACEDFFAGELAFYDKRYEKALKHYLKATTIPHFHFFCYRASAYLFDAAGNLDKALGFTQKALKIYPDDYMTLTLLEKLLNKDKKPEDSIEVHNKIKSVEKEAARFPLASPPKNIQAEASIPITKNEKNNLSNLAVITESCMNTGAEIFSSPQSQDSSSVQALTKRLYPSHLEEGVSDPYMSKNSMPTFTAYEELKRLANISQNQSSDETQSYIAASFGVDAPTQIALEEQIKDFQQSQAELIRNYLEQANFRPKQPDYSLYYLHGWPNNQTPSSLFLTEHSRKSTGGIFIRWNGKGIVINPGPHFLEYFHQQGLHIRDINFVIVTTDQSDCYTDVKEIYELNYQLNMISSDLQVIHYYFNHKALQDLSKILKPHFKQERNALHGLELFIDSPDVEKIDLADGISLHYFLASSYNTYAANQSPKNNNGKTSPTLGIRLDLKNPHASAEKSSVRIGYIAHVSWNPLLAHHLGNCDILLTAFGTTCPNDYNKITYNQDSLGYYGSSTLLEEVAPRLFLCGEFGGKEGDIRLEIAQKLRAEFTANPTTKRQGSTILPADKGLFVNLKNLTVKCSVSDHWVTPSQIKVMKTARAFGKLEYLAPTCCY
jgi:tetratricopeptide (TPR) repeat protein